MHIKTKNPGGIGKVVALGAITCVFAVAIPAFQVNGKMKIRENEVDVVFAIGRG